MSVKIHRHRFLGHSTDFMSRFCEILGEKKRQDLGNYKLVVSNVRLTFI